ncbi:hypothetical protein HAHE_42910 [Haloferula helveola]|uniref:Zinc-finger domain-containing protein n=2 Tax=Haloferula helveola TaxID=490095 RepID=A0ABM7RS94_9BACT|nr:hypothetical protein HAHE_42910 [Haloferula helveola]
MKMTPDDLRLSAYVLGELSADEAAMVERAAAADPAIRLSLREIDGMAGFLDGTFGTKAASLKPSQREAVMRAGREADLDGKVVELASARRRWRPWLTGIGAAAAVAFAAVLLSRLGTETGGGGGFSVSREVALLPLPGPSVGDGEVGVAAGGGGMRTQATQLESHAGEFLVEVAKEIDRSPLPDASELAAGSELSGFSNEPNLRLPVVLGTSSATWVRRWITEKEGLPPKRAVRVEELVNTARLPSPIELNGFRFGAEVIEWQGSKWLGLQWVAGEEDLADFQIRSASKAPRRVIGSFASRDDALLPSTLPAGRSTLVLVEFENPNSAMGEIRFRRGSDSSTMNLDEVAEPAGAEMKHAVAMAAFGLWLRDEVDLAVLTEALGAAESANADPVRQQTHQLIRKAMLLASAGD